MKRKLFMVVMVLLLTAGAAIAADDDMMMKSAVVSGQHTECGYQINLPADILDTLREAGIDLSDLGDTTAEEARETLADWWALVRPEGGTNGAEIQRRVWPALNQALIRSGQDQVCIMIGDFTWTTRWPVLGITRHGIRLAPSNGIVGLMQRNGFDAYSTVNDPELRKWMNDETDKAEDLKSMVMGVLLAGKPTHGVVYMQIGQYIWRLKG